MCSPRTALSHLQSLHCGRFHLAGKAALCAGTVVLVVRACLRGPVLLLYCTQLRRKTQPSALSPHLHVPLSPHTTGLKFLRGQRKKVHVTATALDLPKRQAICASEQTSQISCFIVRRSRKLPAFVVQCPSLGLLAAGGWLWACNCGGLSHVGDLKLHNGRPTASVLRKRGLFPLAMP